MRVILARIPVLVSANAARAGAANDSPLEQQLRGSLRQQQRKHLRTLSRASARCGRSLVLLTNVNDQPASLPCWWT